MPPARGRGRGAAARGKKSPGGAPAKATRATLRQKQSKEETETVEDGATQVGPAEAVGAQKHVGVPGDVSGGGNEENNTGNVDESEAADSQNMSVGEDDLGSDVGKDNARMLEAESAGDTNAEDDDILIATESETLDESVNEADIVIATESETHDESVSEADLTGAEDVHPQNQGGGDDNTDDQDGVGVQSTAEILAEVNEVSFDWPAGEDGGQEDVDESTMNEIEAMVEGEEGMVDIDDFVVIDEDNGENTEQTEDDAEMKKSETVRFKETRRGRRSKKYGEQDTEYKDEVDEKGNQIWQVRVYPVNMGTIRQLRDKWNDLCYTAISADFRLTSGHFARGQVTARLLESGMFQFLVTEPKLQMLMRQIMKIEFPERQVRFEIRRIVLDKDLRNYDADFFDTLLGEVAYRKETEAKKKQEKTQSKKGTPDEASNAEKETTKKVTESMTKATNLETVEVTTNTKTTEVTTPLATDTATETDGDSMKVESEVGVKIGAEKKETESADAEPQKLSDDGATTVNQEPVSEDQKTSTGSEPCSGSGAQVDSKNTESTIKTELNLSQDTSAVSNGVSEKGEKTDGDSSVMTDSEKETQAEKASAEPQNETDTEKPKTGSESKQADVAAGEGEESTKALSEAGKPSDGGEAVKPADTEEAEMSEKYSADGKPIEKEDPVSFRVHLNTLTKGLKQLRDSRKAKEVVESPKDSSDDCQLLQDCQLVLKNLPEGVCDKTLAAIFPFARFIEQTKGEDGVCKAVFETASRSETNTYLNSYTIFVNYEPVKIFGLFEESESYKKRKSKDESRKRGRSRSHSRLPSSKDSPPRKKANTGSRRESEKSSQRSQGSSTARRPQEGVKRKVAQDRNVEAKMTARTGDIKSTDLLQQALPQKIMCPDCGWKALNQSSYKRHRLRHHPTSTGEKGTDAASGTTAAAGASVQRPFSGICHKCRQRGHHVRDCKKLSRMQRNRPKKAGSGRPNLTCRNCMQDGHITKNCPLPEQQRGMARQAEDGARQLEELYSRVVESQRNLTFLQRQAQLGIPTSRPGNMMGNMPGIMEGNMPGASYGMGGGFSRAPQGTPYGMDSQMGMNMGMPFGNVPQRQGQHWYRDT